MQKSNLPSTYRFVSNYAYRKLTTGPTVRKMSSSCSSVAVYGIFPTNTLLAFFQESRPPPRDICRPRQLQLFQMKINRLNMYSCFLQRTGVCRVDLQPLGILRDLRFITRDCVSCMKAKQDASLFLLYIQTPRDVFGDPASRCLEIKQCSEEEAALQSLFCLGASFLLVPARAKGLKMTLQT